MRLQCLTIIITNTEKGGFMDRTKQSMKSVRFKSLLPEIYKMLIMENYTHKEVSEWLKREHDLDLLGDDNSGKHFSNYLSLYGDIKTARESYSKALNKDKTLQAKTWFTSYVSEADIKNSSNAKKRASRPEDGNRTPSATTNSTGDNVGSEISYDDVSESQTAEESKNSFSLAKKFNIKASSNREIPDDPFEGFDANSLKRKSKTI